MESQKIKETLKTIENNGSQESTKKGIKRPRSLTTLKLEIIAERARKISRLKDSIINGKYSIRHNKVAEALIKDSLTEKC